MRRRNKVTYAYLCQTYQEAAKKSALRIMSDTRKDIQKSLFALAAEMAKCTNMPDVEEWPWGARVAKKIYRAAKTDQAIAEEQCRKWALALRRLAEGV